MLNSVYNAICCTTLNHPVTQNPPINNTMVYDQFPSNLSYVTSNVQYLQSFQILLKQRSVSSTVSPTT